MMDMMNNTGGDAGFVVFWGVHVLSIILFLVGAILLILWAAKSLNLGQLRKWGIALVVIGSIACLLTIGAKGSSWGFDNSQMRMNHMQMMENMMNGMMNEHDSSGMNHMGMDDAMSMSMDDMAGMLREKTGDDFDRAFIEMMIPHHQGAIEMAREAQKSARHEEIKRMADAIISAQQQEIDQMNQWLRDWGYAQ